MRRSELLLIVGFLGASAPATAAVAQATGGVLKPDPECACYAPTDSTKEPGGGGGGETPGKTMLLAGAAGLAVLSGLPFGGTTIQGLPFAAAPAPGMPSEVQVAEAPGAVAPDPAATPAMAPTPGAPALVLVPEEAAAGLIPPKTATHLPLLAAMGVLMVGSGGLLARRGAREKRRRRRFVAM